MTPYRSRSHPVRVRRIYDAPAPDDGQRILVDRLWPRGISKDDAHLDAWIKDVTPSTELRKWFHGHRDDYDEFARRYEAELATPTPAEALTHLRELAPKGPCTLLTAAKDPDHSHTSVRLRRL
ncbi:DUF488 domain-containing protein [Streptomyces sp. NPDC051561]|uniref:DUF488 domain-containing protein n=1 Tax=Streptomyces sp. NPDC051561 TaxID=3365658 RepID=UPI0037A2F5C9